jgi:hypothetical protein
MRVIIITSLLVTANFGCTNSAEKEDSVRYRKPAGVRPAEREGGGVPETGCAVGVLLVVDVALH